MIELQKGATMTKQDINRLQEIHGYPCISILVPTHRTMPERLQDPIRVKNLITQATDLLLKEFSKRDIEPFIATLHALADKIDYTRCLDGIAFFANKDIAEVHFVPFSLPEEVVIDDTFYTRFFVRAFNRSFFYPVLLLNTKPARLLLGLNTTLSEIIDPEDARKNQKGFPFEWQWDVTSDRIVQATQFGFKDAGYKSAKDLQFFQQVDQALDAHLAHNDFPLIVIGPEENLGEFKKTTKHAARIIAYVEGNDARAPLDDLSKIIAPILEKYRAQKKADALKLFIESIGTEKYATGTTDVWLRAFEGRVRMLLVEEGFVFPGFKNQAKPQEIIPYDKETAPAVTEDLVDDLIELVLSKNGTVVFVPAGTLKEYGHVGAVLRY